MSTRRWHDASRISGTHSIGSAHAGVHDQELIRRLLGFPADRFCALLITLGTPADRPLTPIERPNRRPFNKVVHRGHW